MKRYFERVDEPFRLKIRELWHKKMREQRKNIFFFDWYESSQVRHFEEFFKGKNMMKKEQKSEAEDLTVIKKGSTEWETTRGNKVDSVHPLFESIQLSHNGGKACPLKSISKNTYGETAKVEHIGHLVEQQNYANLSLRSLGQQTDRIETILMEGYKTGRPEVKINIPSNSQSSSSQSVSPMFVPTIDPNIKLGKQKGFGPAFSEELVSELALKLNNLKVNKNINEIFDNEKYDMVNKIFKPSTLTSTTRNYYPRPTYADLQFEEMPQIQNMTYYNGKEIVEWNLDGFTEYQIFTLCHQMIMYANACIANGNKEREAANMIIIGFSGQLKGWWNNYLNETQDRRFFAQLKGMIKEGHCPIEMVMGIQPILDGIKILSCQNYIPYQNLIKTFGKKNIFLVYLLYLLKSLEEFVLDTFETIQDPKEKRRVLEKFLSRVKTDKDKLKKDIQKSKFLSIDEVFKRLDEQKKKNEKPDLISLFEDQKIMKQDLEEIRKRLLYMLELKEGFHMEEKDEPIQEDDQVVGTIQKYMKQKWYTEVMYHFIDESYFQHITLIDSGADVNCIREGIIPHKYFCKAAHRIRGAD
uniref:DUF7746 domain-containing protein n=2 Tax=Oryza sativa subsp. japonica TaxID=39947 RepID=Q2R7W5_ORYSJ|nr:hypothetical protein LOC_Os11g14710 [Oryza sativa Japonica Group]ABA92444.1 hypothetical protein LOC_Os11g14710 [Oryza sativa Japonica Group]